MMFAAKRIYTEPDKNDGYRVLVDRLWPRGVSKQRAALDAWIKDIAPSPDLRQWFGHKPELFSQFKLQYISELDKNLAVKEVIRLCEEHGKVTLLYAAKDPEVNHAVVLLGYLDKIKRTHHH